MLEVASRPLLTESFDSIEELIPTPSSVYFYGRSVEARSAHSDEWERRAVEVRFCPVVDGGNAQVSFQDGTTIALRAARRLQEYLEGNVGVGAETTCYLDITGLAHHVWAPLLRALLVTGSRLRVVYVEPASYRRSPNPTEGELFELTERIAGIAPLPGFASLHGSDEDVLFVPMLGFEGTRLAYAIEHVQPAGDRIIPLIGVPGFRPEYPFHTYLGNRPSLESTKAWKNARFARANCPFSALYVLEDIAQQWPDSAMKVAPIGTKPHALGAVLFYLLSARPVELVYDNPIRKSQRTTGSDRVSVYHVSSLPFAAAALRGLLY